MSCPNCDLAAVRADHPGYTANCRECLARGIANGPEFWRSRQDGAMRPEYVSALKSIWGEDWEAGNAAVKPAHVRLRALRTSLQGALL
ncbi:hypothetical protein [Variovorax sp. EBFNA2]|uniref:hypothetical protein n=1 Tax=Variovorax sp. EBFNA2 TaxID=3342097 RepID=UPI0029C066FC|nr:hypothetical protein [Variovorax boronicumulans]WPG35325.1 hypothetical protein RZE79_17720 [Variovorax boronicumulans]